MKAEINLLYKGGDKMANDIDINSLSVRTASDSDYLIASVGSRASRVKISSVKSSASNWSSMQNKPFDSVDADDFGITTNTFTGKSTLSISKNITDKVHSHTNKKVLDKFSESNETGVLLYDGKRLEASGIPWNGVSGKPFDEISEDDLAVTDNKLLLSEDIKSQLHSHTNKEIIDKFSTDSEGQLLFDGKAIKGDSAGLDFTALSNSLTGGSLSGISITPNADAQTFDISVNADSIMQNISINDDGFWVINGTVTTVNGKGQDGADGKDGISPTVTATTTSTGVTINITDSNGTQSVGILNGTDGSDGKSAYQTAVDNGFSGDEEAWIKSLHGKDGVTTISTEKTDMTCIFRADGWSSTVPYTQTVQVDGITESLNPRIDVIISDNVAVGKKEEIAFSYFTRVTTGDGILTAYCYETKPNVDLNIMIEVV